MCPRTFDASPLEMEVLGVLDGKAPLAVAEIQKALEKAGRPLAYTTVMTLLLRLQNKGFLTREKNGRQFLYRAAKGQENAIGHLFDKVRQSLFRQEKLKPIVALIDAEDGLTQQELQELRRAIDDKIAGKRKGRKA
jgi:predicted transcriptional regulator